MQSSIRETNSCIFPFSTLHLIGLTYSGPFTIIGALTELGKFADWGPAATILSLPHTTLSPNLHPISSSFILTSTNILPFTFETMDNETARRISGELTAAIEAKDSEQFQRILQEHPEFPPAEHWLAPVHSSAVKSGLQTFKAFVEHFPQSKDWDLGHLGNPVGLAAMEGDVSYLKFLLEELGLKANEGRIMYTPVIDEHCIGWKPVLIEPRHSISSLSWTSQSSNLNRR